MNIPTQCNNIPINVLLWVKSESKRIKYINHLLLQNRFPHYVPLSLTAGETFVLYDSLPVVKKVKKTKYSYWVVSENFVACNGKVVGFRTQDQTQFVLEKWTLKSPLKKKILSKRCVYIQPNTKIIPVHKAFPYIITDSIIRTSFESYDEKVKYTKALQQIMFRILHAKNIFAEEENQIL